GRSCTLAYAAKTDHSYVVMLAAPAGVLLDDLYDALDKSFRPQLFSFDCGVERLDVELVVLLVHRPRNAVATKENGIARTKCRLHRAVLHAFHDALRQTHQLLGGHL